MAMFVLKTCLPAMWAVVWFSAVCEWNANVTGCRPRPAQTQQHCGISRINWRWLFLLQILFCCL